MKKNSYMPILVAITVVCVILGATIHIGGFLLRANMDLFNLKKGHDTEFSEEYTGVKDIEIDVDMSEMTIKSGDKLAISFKGIEDLKPVVTQDGDKLEIKQKGKVKPFHLRPNTTYSEIILTVPEDVTIGTMDMEMDMGNLTVEDIKVSDKLSVDANMGSVEIKSINAPTMDLSADMGSIDVKKSVFTDLSVEADMGSVDIESDEDISEYSMDLSADMGSISVFGKDTDGDYSQSGSKGSIKADLSMGSLTIK